MAQIVNLLVHKMVSDHEDWVLPHTSHHSGNERGHIGETQFAGKTMHMRTAAPSDTQASAITKKKNTAVGLHIFLIVSHWLFLQRFRYPSAYLNIHIETLSVQAVKIFPSDPSLWQHISEALYGVIFGVFFKKNPLMISMFVSVSHRWTECSLQLSFNYVTLRLLNCANTIREMPWLKIWHCRDSCVCWSVGGSL